jgi:Tfp pilus assembly protein PilX
MPLSIKQKQVFGVTSIVVLVVLLLSALQLMSLTRALLQQSRARGELVAMTIYHRAQEVVKSEETAYQDLRSDPGVRASLESALYSEDVAYA